MSVPDPSYNGLIYVIAGTGGYNSEQGASTVTMIPTNQINQFDVTNSVQVKFSRSTFNAKLGDFDLSVNTFVNDTISISASEFIAGITDASYVISVGRLKTMYNDFMMYVDEYFSYANGFSTVFNISSTTSLNSGVFNADAFITLINGQALNPSTGEYIYDLSGTINISTINNILKYVIYSNTFGNRGNIEDGDPDLIFRNYGFVEGDIIYIPSGITITLTLNINANSIELTYLGDAKVDELKLKYDYVDGSFSRNTTTTIDKITQVIRVPLLLKITEL
jgi:hypothetical protein